MFRKLRVKFILISMLSVILVLGAIITGINVANYTTVVDNADEILSMLADNGGRFPDPPVDGDVNPPPQGQPSMDRSPELAFESRFFSALIDGDGNVIHIDTSMIAAVTPEEAEAMARDVYGSEGSKGFSGDYRYLKAAAGNDARIIFYDCGRGLDSFRSFLKVSLLISLAGIVVVFILIFFASGRIVRPVSDSYEKQKRFITDAGHEIKTPLAIINADADVILAEGDSQWASDIKSQVGRLTELTNDLIYLSKMEEGLPEVSMVRTDLSEIAGKACESFSSRFLTENRILDKDIEDGVTVKGDGKSLSQLMSILLDNALKYSPEGGVTNVSLKHTSKGVSLKVTNDTTNDIDKEAAKHLFDRFYRTDKSRNSETGGYGIGLSIAQAIVTAHKGKISAVPGEDGRLTIKVTFQEG